MARRSRKVLRSKRKPQKRLTKSNSKSKSKSVVRKPKVSKLGIPVKKTGKKIPKVSKLGIPVKKTKKKGKKGPSPYNLFVKKMSPVLRKANPGMRQPSIMKLIAKEWNKVPRGTLAKI